MSSATASSPMPGKPWRSGSESSTARASTRASIARRWTVCRARFPPYSGRSGCRSRPPEWVSTGALGHGERKRVEDELGDLLFSMVNVARLQGIDAEDCLRRAADKFTRRFKEVEGDMRAGGRTVNEASAEDLDRAWEAAKAREPRGRESEPGR